MLFLLNESGARQKSLAEDINVSPAAVSVLVSELEDSGYVVRTVDTNDKRATLITLTDLGKARAAELADEKNKRTSKDFDKLTEKEKDQLLKLLEKLTADDKDK